MRDHPGSENEITRHKMRRRFKYRKNTARQQVESKIPVRMPQKRRFCALSVEIPPGKQSLRRKTVILSPKFALLKRLGQEDTYLHFNLSEQIRTLSPSTNKWFGTLSRYHTVWSEL